MLKSNPKIFSGRGQSKDSRDPEQIQRDVVALEQVIAAHPFGRYRVVHVPTKHVTEETVSAMDALEAMGADELSPRIFAAVWTLGHLLKLMDRWNSMSPSIWLYEPLNTDPGPVTIQPTVEVISGIAPVFGLPKQFSGRR